MCERGSASNQSNGNATQLQVGEMQMKGSFFRGRFVCPECGSSQPEPNTSGKDQQPGNGTPRRYACAHCRFEIPVHLAERWGGISIEDARNEWRAVYRDASTAPQTLPQYETEYPDRHIPVGTLSHRSATRATRSRIKGKTRKTYSTEKSSVYGSSYSHAAAGLKSGE